MSFQSWFRKEAAKMARTTAYFLLAFTIIGTMKMLYLAEYDVDGPGVLKAVFGALVVAKVVVVLEATPFAKRFRTRMVALDIAYRSVLYTMAVGVVVTIERIVHGYVEVGTWGGAWEHALQTADLMRFLANVMGIYLCFIGYFLIVTIAKHFGTDRLARFLFTREGAKELPPLEPRVQDPAGTP